MKEYEVSFKILVNDRFDPSYFAQLKMITDFVNQVQGVCSASMMELKELPKTPAWLSQAVYAIEEVKEEAVCSTCGQKDNLVCSNSFHLQKDNQ